MMMLANLESIITPSIYENAEILADLILSLLHGNKQVCLKLPLVFTCDEHSIYQSGRNNLIALIKTASNYDDGLIDGTFPVLLDLIYLYNSYGGKPSLNQQNIRKMHNWINTLNFILRFAIMKQEEIFPTTGQDWDDLNLSERVYARLFNPYRTRRNFMSHPYGEKYELKPLKYASEEVMIKWIDQEYEAMKNHKNSFDIKLSKDEWDFYGLKGHKYSPRYLLMKSVKNMVESANNLDNNGNYAQSDIIYDKLMIMSDDLESISCV